MNDLCEFEVEVLRALNGEREPIKWGAALGAALGFLKGSGYVSLTNGTYAITEKGKSAITEPSHG